MDNDFSEKRNKIYNELTNLVLQGLDSGTLNIEDAQDASRFILERLDNISDDIFLYAFLEEIASRWKFFQPILLSQKKENSDFRDQKQINSVTQEIEKLSQNLNNQ